MPLQVALLDERPIAFVAMERPLTAMHANMGSDTEQFGICPSALIALEELVRPVGFSVANENLLVASGVSTAVFKGTVLVFVGHRTEFLLIQASGRSETVDRSQVGFEIGLHQMSVILIVPRVLWP